tara:strand:+ start:63 stop:245 length:183 start_codon:yes stop_codon:yes gene_type:complete
MPYKIRKVKNQSCYKVYNAKTKKIYAKCSTKENAKKQMRLLQAFKNNPQFRKTMKSKRNS